MSYKVRDMIENLDYDELLKINNDIEKGSIHIRGLVKDKIRQHELMHKKICSVCLSEIDPYSTNSFTLVFGPEDFRKKATFCAIDCMEYFLENLKGLKKKNE